jgi:hypothetical protein
MMAAVAAFADSDEGRFHALVSQSYGVDPAAGLRDDVVTVNLRAALYVASHQLEPDDFESRYGG